MPPRAPVPHGMDEVSRMIGELSAYMHEGRHGVNNLSTKFDALALDIAKRVEAMRTELSIRLDGMDARIAALEAVADQNRGAKNLVTWILQSPLIGWIAAGFLLFVAWWKKP